MIEKCRILYKGDIIASGFYIFIGVLLAVAGFLLFQYTDAQRFKFLSISLLLFFIYCTGKGILMYIVSSQRYNYYVNTPILTSKDFKEEIVYTEYRMHKKYTNRRKYIWTIIISSMLAFVSIFTSSGAFIAGTCIPVALIAAAEFCIGLLTEFRLREYYRILLK
jgi:hypothetical protein